MNTIITAVICTCNRNELLSRSIESLINQSFDKEKYQILVVDNNSSEETKALVKDYRDKAGNIDYICEPVQGLSKARNAGWRQARGKYVAFIDDDAQASPEWLENIVLCFEEAADNCAVISGSVFPIWEVRPPKWLTGRMRRFLSLIERTDHEGEIADENYLAGTNISYKKTCLSEIRGFNEELGRNKNCLLSMEELHLKRKLHKYGWKTYYYPQIRVDHYIPESRLKRGWFLKRFFWQGRSEARCFLMLNGQKQKDRISILGKYLKHIIERRLGIRKGTDTKKKIHGFKLFEFILLMVKHFGFVWELLFYKRKNRTSNGLMCP